MFEILIKLQITYSGTQTEGGGRTEEIKNYILHEHPLSLIEVHCHKCGRPFSGKLYNCSRCNFNPQWCSACGEAGHRPSGSFYIYKLCWPNTPIFHQSCAELPQEIKITFRPHNSLYLVEKSSCYKMIGRHQERVKQHYKFYCDECSFEIGFGCAATIINSHVGHEYFKHFFHYHTLTLMTATNQKWMSKLCRKNISGPTYGCAICEFFTSINHVVNFRRLSSIFFINSIIWNYYTRNLQIRRNFAIALPVVLISMKP